MHLLNKQQISEALLAEHLSSRFNLYLFNSIDSTNRYLKDLPISNTLDICCAEMQTQGRGRFGRSWHSPFGENIYCSCRLSFNYDRNMLSGLSLVTSLAVLATLNDLHLSADIKIKWPNDILWADKKLCGSLIEVMPEQIIIGIGLNVNTDTQNHPLPDKAWCSLYEISKHHFDRNILIAKLIANLERYLIQFMHHDLNSFMDEWDQSDYLAGKNIKVNQSSNTFLGVACGINPIGQLILKEESGEIHFFSSGDTSLKEC